MTTNRADRPSRTPVEAVEEIRRCSRAHFDESVVAVYLAAFSEPSPLPLPV